MNTLNSRGLARKDNAAEREACFEAYRLALLAVGPVNNAERAAAYREVLRAHLGIVVTVAENNYRNSFASSGRYAVYSLTPYLHYHGH